MKLDCNIKTKICNHLEAKGYVATYSTMNFSKSYEGIHYSIKLNQDSLKLEPRVAIRYMVAITSQKEIDNLQIAFNKAKIAAEEENEIIKGMIKWLIRLISKWIRFFCTI